MLPMPISNRSRTHMDRQIVSNSSAASSTHRVAQYPESSADLIQSRLSDLTVRVKQTSRARIFDVRRLFAARQLGWRILCFVPTEF